MLTTKKYHGIALHPATLRWQVKIKVAGKQYFIAEYPEHEAEYAANDADWARWWLQDFLPRAPKYNFPNQLPPLGRIRNSVLRARYDLMFVRRLEFPFKHHPEWREPEFTHVDIELNRPVLSPH